MASPKAPILAESKTKQLVVKKLSLQSSMFKIVYEGGGEAPDELKGAWTSPIMAQRAIDVYLKAQKA